MKNLAILLLLFFINCSSQQIITDKKYMDMETTFQKYRDIKARYDSLVEKNKQNLVYENGAYFKKSLYSEEAKEKRNSPEKSDSKLVLDDDGKEIFVVSYTRGDLLYTYKNNKLYERINLSKDENELNSVFNTEENKGIEYYPDGRIYIYSYEKNEMGENELISEKLYQKNKLLHEKNYKKDFIVSKEQMLKKLADNFYSNAISYSSYNNVRKEQLNKDEIELINNKIALLKESITEAIASKNFFYKEIKISKNYNQDNQPIYDVSFPFEAKIPTPNAKWDLQIDGKTNKVLKIEFVNLID